MKIFDGSSDSYYNKVLTKGCGSSLPPPVYSSGRNIYVKFSSDSSGQGKGFVAHYKALNSSSGGVQARCVSFIEKIKKERLTQTLVAVISSARSFQGGGVGLSTRDRLHQALKELS